jgi:hypothetical protein
MFYLKQIQELAFSFVALFLVIQLLCARFVLPVLEYSCPVWNPYLIQDIKALESVQRNFTRIIPALRRLPYYKRLPRLNLVPREVRRLWLDVTLCFKIVNYTWLAFYRLFFFLLSIRSSKEIVLLKDTSGPSPVRFSVFNRVLNMWNSLPDSVRCCKSLSTFRRLLRSDDLSARLRFDVLFLTFC